MEIKKGTILKCIDDSNYDSFTKGNIYLVTKDLDEDFVWLQDDYGFVGWLMYDSIKSNFIDVTPNEIKQLILRLEKHYEKHYRN